METRKILISDETLRDGQQQPYVVFSDVEMVDIALTVHGLGSAIYNIDIMPSMFPLHADVAELLIEGGVPVTLATFMKREAIERTSHIGNNIITISSLSDSLMAAKEITRESNILCTTSRLRYANSMGLRVGLAGEGSAASDADLGFIVEYINACGDMIDYFIYCDTDGRADPADTFGRIAFIRKKTSKPIFMHCHNDKNNAVENTIQGILAGAEGISSTFTGIGDRAGNAPIEEVLYQLREKYGIVVDGIDYDKIPALTKMVGAYAGRGPAQPGEDLAKVHEAGIHIDALLKATKKGINVYGTEPGLARVVAGISSGMATMELIYHMYSLEFDSTEASEVLREIKQEAYKKKTSFGPLEVWDYIISRRVKRNLTVEEQHLPTDPFEAFEKTYVAQNGFDRPLTL